MRPTGLESWLSPLLEGGPKCRSVCPHFLRYGGDHESINSGGLVCIQRGTQVTGLVHGGPAPHPGHALPKLMLAAMTRSKAHLRKSPGCRGSEVVGPAAFTPYPHPIQ